MISGLPYLVMASFKASTQNLASSVFESRHASTFRVAQSIMATRYKNPRCTIARQAIGTIAESGGIYVISEHQTWFARVIGSVLGKQG